LPRQHLSTPRHNGQLSTILATAQAGPLTAGKFSSTNRPCCTPKTPHPPGLVLTLPGLSLSDPPDGLGDFEVVVSGQGLRRLPQLHVTEDLLGDLLRRSPRGASGCGTNQVA